MGASSFTPRANYLSATFCYLLLPSATFWPACSNPAYYSVSQHQPPHPRAPRPPPDQPACGHLADGFGRRHAAAELGVRMEDSLATQLGCGSPRELPLQPLSGETKEEKRVVKLLRPGGEPEERKGEGGHWSERGVGRRGVGRVERGGGQGQAAGEGRGARGEE